MTDPRYPIGRFAPPADYTVDCRASFVRDLSGAPSAFRAALDGLSAEQRLTPYRDGGWTIAQVVHHVADSHMHAYARMKFAATEDVPTIKAYDERIWAAFPDASHANVDPSLQLIESLHTRWTAFLTGLSQADFERGLMHPERGAMTIDRMVALYAWHGRHHVAHITELRKRMGW
jgi:uncharacterized damage-inducible protein DinB